MCGFYVGKIFEPPLLPSFNIDIVYSPNSNIAGFDGYTGKQLEKALQGTNLEGLGFWFSYYAWQNNISSLYLVAHAIHESGWGTSWIAKRKNNLFGFGAYDSSPYWSANYYPTKKDCIKQVSGFIAKNYLSKGGLYYVSPTLAGMNIHYATDKQWALKVSNIMNYLSSKIGNPNREEAIAESSYYQNFENKDYDLSLTFNKYVSKGQFVRDMYALFAAKHWNSAGEWALSLKLVKDSPKWWTNKITRNEEIKVIDRLYGIYHPYWQKPELQGGDFYEKYNKWYCLLIYKLEDK